MRRIREKEKRAKEMLTVCEVCVRERERESEPRDTETETYTETERRSA